MQFELGVSLIYSQIILMILYDGGRALVIDKKNVSDHCVA